MKGDWAWTGNRREIFIPDVKIEKDDPSYVAVPVRGYGHTMAVYDESKDKIIGWVSTEDLGYKNVKEFMASPQFESLAQFEDEDW